MASVEALRAENKSLLCDVLRQLKSNRSYAKASATKLINSINELMKDKANLTVVSDKVLQLEKASQTFSNIQGKYHTLLLENGHESEIRDSETYKDNVIDKTCQTLDKANYL